MKFEYIKEFIVLVESKNFTKTAEKLFLTQSALSRHISTIEDELGVLLIQRTTHDFLITSVGEEVYKYFKKIYELRNEMDSIIETYKSGLEGRLTIGMLYYSIEKYVTPIVNAFSMKYSNIQIDFKSLQPHVLIENLLDNKIDIGMIFTIDDSNDLNLNFIKLNKIGYVALMSKSHRLSNRESISLKELEDEKILLFKEDKYSTDITLKALEIAGFKPKEIVYTEHIDTIPFAIEKTGSIHLTSEDLTNTFSTLKAVKILDEKLYHFTSFAYRKDNNNPAVKLFINELKTI